MKRRIAWGSRVLACAMTLMCFVGNTAPMSVNAAGSTYATTSAEESEETVRYVALGDSISWGSNTYVSTVSNYLEQSYGECITNNLAMDAWQSGDLLDALTNAANSRYSAFRTAISKADIITLDIGSNDILQTTMGIVSAGLGCSPDQLKEVTTVWSEKLETATGLAKLQLGYQALSLAYPINYELNNGDTLPNAISAFETNFINILKVIKQLAPEARVYIGNLYNPYVDAAPVYIGDFKAVDMEEAAKTNVLKMNTIIRNNAGGYTIVDLYNTINNPKYIKGDVVNYDYDPHPNAAGHKAIASRFISAIAADN